MNNVTPRNDSVNTVLPVSVKDLREVGTMLDWLREAASRVHVAAERGQKAQRQAATVDMLEVMNDLAKLVSAMHHRVVQAETRRAA